MSTALWVIYDYEVSMFYQMLQFCTTEECRKFPPPVQNAIVESMLLHLRILVDILLSRGSSKDKDDIKLMHLLPSFTSPLIGQLKAAYGNSNGFGCPCWQLNKRLAHPTTIRSSAYSYDYLLRVLMPLVDPLLKEIAAARP